MTVKPKKRGARLEMRTFDGKDGESYLVFRTSSGAYHTFAEVEATEAARTCGAKGEGKNTRALWSELWPSKPRE